jgi:hypothetical protein
MNKRKPLSWIGAVRRITGAKKAVATEGGVPRTAAEWYCALGFNVRMLSSGAVLVPLERVGVVAFRSPYEAFILRGQCFREFESAAWLREVIPPWQRELDRASRMRLRRLAKEREKEKCGGKRKGAAA